MRVLRGVLATNGAVFLLRAVLNVFRPTSFYLEPDAPKYAADAVQVMGITYASLGAIQIGVSQLADRAAVQIVSGASMLFAGGVAAKAATQSSGSQDGFHRMRLASAAENLIVAALYGALLVRSNR